MRNIKKGAEPKSLEGHRCNTFANYDNLDAEAMQELRESLVAEQRGLCCYCMSRIAPNDKAMKIEHWKSQSEFPGHQLDYSNLLGACLGGEGKPKGQRHCDTHRGNRPLSKHPADPAHDVELILHYEKNGTIRSSDAQFEQDINRLLNLNIAFLKSNRRLTLERFITEGPKRGDWNNAWLEKRLAEWNGDETAGLLEPHCQIVVYWIRKRLKRS